MKMSTLSTEYIGSKRPILGFITEAIETGAGAGPKEIFDLFSGTGVVSAAFKAKGYAVRANDHLEMCATLTSAALFNHRAPTFEALPEPPQKSNLSRYQAVLNHLNGLEPRRGGFIHRNYSPASALDTGIERRYFSEENAARIDTIRQQIQAWKQSLSLGEHSLLLSDLVRAASTVSNVAGTYGCYLKQWKPRALATLEMKPGTFVHGRQSGHYVLSEDASSALSKATSRIVYADPPYTKRQYAAYYHVLETIVLYDDPELTGSTGLRNWQTHSSEFCYKRKAEAAFEQLLQNAKCEHFFVSYSDDGQVPHERLFQLFSHYGPTTFTELKLRRYKSSRRPHKGPLVSERLYHVKMK